MKTYDVITIGSAIADLFLSISDVHQSVRLNSEQHELSVKFGEKIELNHYDLMVGGNATNAAVSFSRFGFTVSLVAEIGDDEFAHKIHKVLESEGVDTSQLVLGKGALSSLTVGINFQKERTLFVGHVPRKHDFVFDDIKTEWVYLTSLGKEWKKAYDKAVSFISTTQALLAFNPGTLQVQAGYEAIKDALAVTEILFVNKEEAARIFNFQFSIFNENEKKAIKNLLKKLQEHGPKNVVITDGKNGSYALDESGKMWFLDVFPALVVEKTGAGDAFASGFMSGIISGVEVQEALRWGTANAASVIGKVGAQAGLLTKDAIKQKLESITVQAQVI